MSLFHDYFGANYIDFLYTQGGPAAITEAYGHAFASTALPARPGDRRARQAVLAG